MSKAACLFLACLVPIWAGCVSVDLSQLFQQELEEETVQDADGLARDKVLMIDVSGIISSLDGGWGDFHCTPTLIKASLEKAAADPRIKAVMLRIDSPGGEVTATDMIYREIMAFKAETGLPVYATILGLGCSGGYYIACAADRVYCHPTTVTGSIGIIARFPKLRGLADKVGYDEEILTSGNMKAMGHPLQEMTPEVREVLQSTIDEMYVRFLDVVQKRNPGAFANLDTLRPLADGRVYTATQAHKAGLVDEIQYLGDALDQLQMAAGVPGARVVTYTRGRVDDANIYSRAVSTKPWPSTAQRVEAVLERWYQPGFFYLWLPASH